MVFTEINQTGIIGTLINSATTNLTGSLYLTFLILFVGLLLMLLAFRIPFEIGLIMVLPVLIMFSAFIAGFQLTLVLALLFVGIVLAKWFII